MLAPLIVGYVTLLVCYLTFTLVLPRLRCGDAPMAYPCYAWYHRAMTKDAKWNGLKVAMPRYCPTYLV